MINWDAAVTPPTAEEIALREEAEVARTYLRDTDRYVIRFVETQVPVPAEVSAKRAEARLKIAKVEN